jgi:chromosome segregation and condensation protein ScpB
VPSTTRWQCPRSSGPGAGKLIETTESRVAYFGIELDDDEESEFCWNNV